MLGDAEQVSEDERSHSRNEVTKKTSTMTPQNEFSSWHCPLVKNQRAVPRFDNLRPRHPKPPGNPGGRGCSCNCDGRRGLDGKRGPDPSLPARGTKQKNRAAQRVTKCVRSCASACQAVCPTPLAVENLNTRSRQRSATCISMMGADIISAHHMVLRDTDQASTMDKLLRLSRRRIVGPSLIARSLHQLAQRTQARSRSRGVTPL